MTFLSTKISVIMEEVEIIKGEDHEISIQVRDGENPLDLTGITAIKMILKGSSAPVELSLEDLEIEIVSLLAGSIKAIISDTKSALLRSGASSFELEIDDDSDKRICQVTGKLTVKERL
jgi:hypothetical protein